MTGIIIQARMGSSRLPGKILKNFEGRTLLEHIIVRLSRINSEVNTVIATSELDQDDKVEAFCREHRVCCFRGDELNVLKRYYDCANLYHFDNIVRMTGDNPFPDIEELDRLITFHVGNNMEFSENFSVLPIGVGMEIMSYKALEDSFNNATLPKHFEHADEYILDNLRHYRYATLNVAPSKNKPEVRLTVDTPEDYEKACYILRNAETEYVTTEQAIALSDVYERRDIL
jgi:spore coat polysaccharide biosynthesis protein SpsF